VREADWLTALTLIAGRLDETGYNRKTEDKRTDVGQAARPPPLTMFSRVYTRVVLCLKKYDSNDITSFVLAFT